MHGDADDLIKQVDDLANDVVSLYPKLVALESFPKTYKSPERAKTQWARASYLEFLDGMAAGDPGLHDALAQLETLIRRVRSFADLCESFFPVETRPHAAALRQLDLSPKNLDKATLDNMHSAARHLREIRTRLSTISVISAADELLKNAAKRRALMEDEAGRTVRASDVESEDLQPISAEQTASRTGEFDVASESTGAATSRRAEVDDYIREVFEATGKQITYSQFWRVAGYNEATPFERWCKGTLPKGCTADLRFRSVLREKPHLKDPTLGRKPKK